MLIQKIKVKVILKSKVFARKLFKNITTSSKQLYMSPMNYYLYILSKASSLECHQSISRILDDDSV